MANKNGASHGKREHRNKYEQIITPIDFIFDNPVLSGAVATLKKQFRAGRPLRLQDTTIADVHNAYKKSMREFEAIMRNLAQEFLDKYSHGAEWLELELYVKGSCPVKDHGVSSHQTPILAGDYASLSDLQLAEKYLPECGKCGKPTSPESSVYRFYRRGDREVAYSHAPNVVEQHMRIKTPASLVQKVADQIANIEAFVPEAIRKQRTDYSDYVLDLGGITLITEEAYDCYRVIMEDLPKTGFSFMHPVKDYISSPKGSGYKSLQVVAERPLPEKEGILRCEFKVRTTAIQKEIDSEGLAHHDTYKMLKEDARRLAQASGVNYKDLLKHLGVIFSA